MLGLYQEDKFSHNESTPGWKDRDKHDKYSLLTTLDSTTVANIKHNTKYDNLVHEKKKLFFNMMELSRLLELVSDYCFLHFICNSLQWNERWRISFYAKVLICQHFLVLNGHLHVCQKASR